MSTSPNVPFSTFFFGRVETPFLLPRQSPKFKSELCSDNADDNQLEPKLEPRMEVEDSGLRLRDDETEPEEPAPRSLSVI